MKPGLSWNSLETRHAGYWGEHTSSVDWCEPNYRESRYVAETLNTLTSVLPFTVLALLGLANVYQQRLPARLALGPLGILTVALGSAAFHLTLTRTGQHADELPMLAFLAIQFAFVTDTRPRTEADKASNWWLPVLLFVVNTGVIVSCLLEHERAFLLFAAAFASQLMIATARAVVLSRGERVRPADQAVIARIAWLGTICFVLAFVCWNIDNLLCLPLLRLQRRIPLFGILLNGHSAWHLGAFYASTVLATGAQFLHLCLTEPALPVTIIWRHGGLMPYVVRRVKAG